MADESERESQRPTHDIEEVDEVFEKVWRSWEQYGERSDERVQSAIVPWFGEDNESDESERATRRFELVRHEDNTGTSGTGVVAVGVEYPDGAVHMQWLNDRNDDLNTSSNGVAFKPAPDGIEATREIHGHEGRTEVRFID